MTGAPLHPEILDGLREQLRRRDALLAAGARHVGWKVALLIGEIEALIGDRPVVGHLTSATTLAPGATFDTSGIGELRAETELALEIGADGGVRGAAVALELVDVARPPEGTSARAILAEDVLHRGVVFGPVRRGPPPPACAATATVDGAVAEQATASPDPGAVVAGVAEVLAALGLALTEGDLVLCGSITHVPVTAGQRVAARIDGLGEVDVRLI